MAFVRDGSSEKPSAFGPMRKHAARGKIFAKQHTGASLHRGTVLSITVDASSRRVALVEVPPRGLRWKVPLHALAVQPGQSVIVERRFQGRAVRYSNRIVVVESLVSAAPAQAGARLAELAREIDANPHELVDDVRAAVVHVPAAPQVYADMDHRSLDALRAGGLALSEVPAVVDRASTWTFVETRAIFRESVTPEQVAHQTGTTLEAVQRAVDERRLLSITLDGALRLPGYQFGTDGAPIAGLGDVVTSLPPGLHPVAVMRFFTTPHPELDDEGSPLSPLEWLVGGLDTRPVEELAADLLRGQ